MLASLFKPHHLVLIALICAAPPQSARAQAPQPGDTARGKVLTDPKGMTLYTYDLDSSGKSTCFENCIETWPPAMAAANENASGSFTLIQRGMGRQWAYKGKPLYLWKDDKKPGDITGDRVNQVWRLARP
jgi:predicted lipoprotein with Yx(FWY)xxD motif